MDAQATASWQRQQIETILEDTIGLQNEAWLPSIQTATKAMERGVRARFFPRKAAQLALARAMQARQSEPAPSGRWYIASLVEGLATIRFLSLKPGSGVSSRDYETAKNLIFEHFRNPPGRGGSPELRHAIENLFDAMGEEAMLKSGKKRHLVEFLSRGDRKSRS